ncbi:conjugal transfer protein TraH [Psychromonas aquimarina]|uniref:conjugal transfer protein TraH n=1 Tax=Psychromonas aquimarina TaxID=444919 RepID=UPI00048B269D|nr:conjugal transfer protein TraH [Psychromonas aquimarina]
MMKNKLVIAISMFIIATSTKAGSFNNEMERTFNSMSNVTNAKAYNTARRGIANGGQLYIRNDIKRINLVSAQAPSFSAGCGGIDIFGGSFSYINKDQFIETFQAIGANALGYGVKLAIASACNSCEQIMTSLEKTAQAINKMNMDSCTAAQGIVDAGVDFSTTAKAETKAANNNTNRGIAEDFQEAWNWPSTDGKSNSKKQKETNPAKYASEITGNITWRALIENNVKTTYGGDNSLLEVFQSMVGTVVVADQSTDSESSPSITTYVGQKISLSQLMI